jgi:hypothetical protein
VRGVRPALVQRIYHQHVDGSLRHPLQCLREHTRHVAQVHHLQTPRSTSEKYSRGKAAAGAPFAEYVELPHVELTGQLVALGWACGHDTPRQPTPPLATEGPV